MSEFKDETTGRYLVFFHPGGYEDAAKALLNTAGIRVVPSAGEANEIANVGPESTADTITFPALGVAVVAEPPKQISRLEIGNRSVFRVIRPEYVFRIIPNVQEPEPDVVKSFERSDEYLRGFRDGVNVTVDNILNRRPGSPEMAPSSIQPSRDLLEEAAASFFQDTDEFTWGLQAVGAHKSSLAGNGVAIAILDTGFDSSHPDFRDRGIVNKNFVSSVDSAFDDNGHGTHCLGVLCGPRKPSTGRRYGIACDANAFVGKVMSKDGKGVERDILNGIHWALQNRCRVISLSIGKAVLPTTQPDSGYEQIGNAAMQQNCLIIAAAGNESQRPRPIRPVDMPANSRKILAVSAISRKLSIYPQSNGGINTDGGGIDFCAPGVEVYSSLRKVTATSQPYGSESGTSAATPHVAAVAALLMEADPNANAEQILARITSLVRRLPLQNSDIGSGLIQLP